MLRNSAHSINIVHPRAAGAPAFDPNQNNLEEIATFNLSLDLTWFLRIAIK
jgi:hypothetical protein